MGKPKPHKHRKRRHPVQKASKAQRLRRANEMVISNESNYLKTAEVHLNNTGALESTQDLPIISTILGKDYFEKQPFSALLIEENEEILDMSDTIIKTEPDESEFNPLHEIEPRKQIEKSVYGTVQQLTDNYNIQIEGTNEVLDISDTIIIKTKPCESTLNPVMETEICAKNEEIITPDLKTALVPELEQQYDLKDYNMRLIEKSDEILEISDTVVIKTESCESTLKPMMETEICVENKEIITPDLKTTPVSEPKQQNHLKDHNVHFYGINISNCDKQQKISHDENLLLCHIIKYLDKCAKLDKFDLAGKFYAAKLRSVMVTNQQTIAENLCRQVLLEAEHFNLDEKIILLKKPLYDYISNKKTRDEINKISYPQPSFHLQREKDGLLIKIKNHVLENTKEDRFDKFGEFCASKMRTFSDIQYFYADKLINEIVLEAELCRLRANFKLTKLGDPPSHSFVMGKSYAKTFNKKHSVLPISDVVYKSKDTLQKQLHHCPVNTVKKSAHKQFTYSSCKPSLNTLSQTTDVISSENEVRQISDVVYNKKETLQTELHQFPKNVRKSFHEQFTYSSCKPSLSILTQIPEVVFSENEVQQVPTLKLVSNAVLNAHSQKNTINKQIMNIDKKFENFSSFVSLNTDNIFTKNNIVFKTLPSSSISNQISKTIRKHINKQSKNDSVNIESSLGSLQPTAGFISLEKEMNQFSGALSSSSSNILSKTPKQKKRKKINK